MKKYFLICLIFINIVVSAQNIFEKNTDSYEDIVLFTDRDLYLSGERIWFNATCTSNSKFSNETVSKVTYFELFNDEKKPVIQKKIRIIKGKSSSYIQIPENIETGVYNLVAYTQFMKNYKGFKSNRISLIIINPSKKGNIDLTNSKKQIIDTLVFGTNFNLLEVSTVKSIYKTREKVEVNIVDSFNLEKLKHLTVSVVKKGSLNNHSNSRIKQKENIEQINYNKIKYFPEIRDLTLSGTIIEKETNNPISNSKVYLSVLDSDNQININKSDKNGRFIFTINSLYNNHDIYICTEDNSINSEILINNSFLNELDYFKPIGYNIDSIKLELIKKMYLNYQTSVYFPEKSEIYKIDEETVENFFGDTEISIKLDDYISLPTLKEVFSEIVTFVYLKKNNEDYIFLVYDDKNKTSFTGPLVFYDNIPIFDINKLLKVAPKYIDRINVINRKYIIGNYTINGIIFLKSKNGKLPGYKISENSKITKYQTTYESSQIKFPGYREKDNIKAHLPDFRTLLYWNSDILLQKNKKVSFYTSDHSSEYDVIVRGISPSGKRYFGKTSFKVKK